MKHYEKMQMDKFMQDEESRLDSELQRFRTILLYAAEAFAFIALVSFIAVMGYMHITGQI